MRLRLTGRLIQVTGWRWINAWWILVFVGEAKWCNKGRAARNDFAAEGGFGRSSLWSISNSQAYLAWVKKTQFSFRIFVCRDLRADQSSARCWANDGDVIW